MRRLRRKTIHALLVCASLVGSALVATPAHAAANTVVTLSFNDGLVSQYKYAEPVLAAHNVNGSFYTVTNWMGRGSYMAFWQLDNLYRRGNEIGGMGMDHKDLTQSYYTDPATDQAYKRDQVCADRANLVKLGYDPQTFAYPGGVSNASAQSIVQGCGYAGARLIGGLRAQQAPYAETVPPANAYGVRTASMGSGPITLASLQNAVTAASTHGGGWVPITFNQVCDQSDPGYSTCMSTNKPVDAAVLSDFLDWVQTQPGVSVQTMRQVLGLPQTKPLPPRPTYVSLTFDDGDRTQYGLLDTFVAHNMAGTFYVNSGAVDGGDPTSMTWTQLRALAAAGNEIGGHTRNHTNLKDTSISYDTKVHEVCDDRARLMEMGFAATSFAYPFAAFSPEAEQAVQSCGYSTARTGGSLSPEGPRYAETMPVSDPYAVRALGTTYNGPITLESMQQAVNAADNHGGGWLPLVFHEVCYAGTPSYDSCMTHYRPVSDTVFNQFLDWLAAQRDQGVQVATMGQVADLGGR